MRLAEGFSAEGEYLVAVDRSSLRLCGYAPGHASVFGFFEEKALAGGRLDVPLCPRTNLKRILKYLEWRIVSPSMCADDVIRIDMQSRTSTCNSSSASRQSSYSSNQPTP